MLENFERRANEVMSINSKQKGKRGELYVVNAFKDNGFKCNRTAQFKGNTGRADDIEGIDYIHCEVKFVENLNISKAMEQAVRDSKASDRQAFPTACHKKNYQELMVTMQFSTWIKLYNSFYSDMKLMEREENEKRKP